MTAPLPTTDALDLAVAELVTRVAPWCRIADAVTAIRRMQYHADLESLDQTVTRVESAPVVFDLDAFRASRTMVQDDDDGGRAA